jgi:hypothetical protein
MHRKDDQYSPGSFLDTENDVSAYEVVSMQKSFAPGGGHKSDQQRESAIDPAMKCPEGGAAPASSDTKFYKSPHV